MNLKNEYIVIVQILLLGTIFWSCTGKGTPGYEATKLSLEEQEKIAPNSFLEVSGTFRENLIGETVVEGKVKSSASVAKYKDLVLSVIFYTKTDTYLGSEDFVLYEFINPGTEVDFKIKTNAPNGTDQIGLEVKEAVSVD